MGGRRGREQGIVVIMAEKLIALFTWAIDTQSWGEKEKRKRSERQISEGQVNRSRWTERIDEKRREQRETDRQTETESRNRQRERDVEGERRKKRDRQDKDRGREK